MWNRGKSNLHKLLTHIYNPDYMCMGFRESPIPFYESQSTYNMSSCSGGYLGRTRIGFRITSVWNLNLRFNNIPRNRENPEQTHEGFSPRKVRSRYLLVIFIHPNVHWCSKYRFYKHSFLWCIFVGNKEITLGTKPTKTWSKRPLAVFAQVLFIIQFYLEMFHPWCFFISFIIWISFPDTSKYFTTKY